VSIKLNGPDKEDDCDNEDDYDDEHEDIDCD
jgi:hypothetical protein